MGQRRGKTWVLVLALAPAPAGCGTTRNHPGEPAVAPMPTAEVAAPPAKDLPPDRAAKVCIAVAAELEKGGYEAEAIEQYEKAVKLEPRSTRARHRLAVLHDRQGDFVRAQSEYHEALKADPKNPDLLNDMGYFCYERGEWTESERRLRQALAAAPKCDRARVNLGMALAQQGKSDEALAEFSAVVGPAQAQANLGLIEAQRGRTAEAKRALRKSLALEPLSKVARVALQQLEKPPAAVADRKPSDGRLSAN